MKSNGTGIFVKAAGIVILIAGFIYGFIQADINYWGYSSFEWSIAVAYWMVSFIIFVFFISLGEIISLLSRGNQQAPTAYQTPVAYQMPTATPAAAPVPTAASIYSPSGQTPGQSSPMPAASPTVQAAPADWTCPNCGTQNDGGPYCTTCGLPNGQ